MRDQVHRSRRQVQVMDVMGEEVHVEDKQGIQVKVMDSQSEGHEGKIFLVKAIRAVKGTRGSG